jgi:hypothetical protein
MADGVYDAELLAVDVVDAAPGAALQGPYNRWRFAIFTDLHTEPMELIANSSTAFGKQSKARRWMQAILGRAISPGEIVNTDELCPIPCQVIVKNDVESGFLRIEDVMGPRNRQRGTQGGMPPGTPASSRPGTQGTRQAGAGRSTPAMAAAREDDAIPF